MKMKKNETTRVGIKQHSYSDRSKVPQEQMNIRKERRKGKR